MMTSVPSSLMSVWVCMVRYAQFILIHARCAMEWSSVESLISLVFLIQGAILAIVIVLAIVAHRAARKASRYARQAHHSATQRLYRNELYSSNGKMIRYDDSATPERRPVKKGTPAHAPKKAPAHAPKKKTWTSRSPGA